MSEGLTGAAGGGALADGRYQLHERLGSGGMGLVFRATDTALGRQVAIKVLSDVLSADDEARTRFGQEARAAARLNHPNVTQVYDVREEDGRPYFVMELVDGPSVSDLVAEHGRLEPGRVAEIARGALAGLRAAHEAGLLHRDVKPANILQQPDGTVKITDFGIATAADAPNLTRAGMVVGTAEYLAPERREGGPASPRSDLYALGASLWEMLTGAKPGEDATAEMGTDIPAGLRRLVRACSSRDPDDRPGSAAEAMRLLDPDAGPATEQVTRAAPAGTAVLEAEDDDREPWVQPLPPREPEPAVEEPEPAWQPPRHRGLSERLPGGVGAWLAVALGLVAVVLVAQSVLGGGPPGGGVEPAGDPAETARRLSDWILERAG